MAELVATFVRFMFIVLGLVAGLELLGATALLGAVLGGAGVIGIALGFAVRDTVDNYVSSLMLSLRQPFRANDHVVIEGHEGRVVRLTSRATILMTLDGNHLRIPNSTVFKAVILNYTRNPERRFDFELGVDANDDPMAAIKSGLEAIGDLDFVLDDPAPMGNIVTVGDSNIVLCFRAWVDQEKPISSRPAVSQYGLRKTYLKRVDLRCLNRFIVCDWMRCPGRTVPGRAPFRGNRRPKKKVQRLMLVSVTPRKLRQKIWPTCVPSDTLMRK
jgi:small-conductance mechanosensitive channel